MKVALATIGKFHTFALARQLLRFDALATVITGYPWFKLQEEGVPRRFVDSFQYVHAPYMATGGKVPASVTRAISAVDRISFDQYARLRMKPYDIFHWLSGFNLKSARAARNKGALLIVDRGSTHILHPDEILRPEYDRLGLPFTPTPSIAIDYELAEYELADAITLPSSVCLDTFVQHGVPREKLLLTPYGVDVDRFQPLARPPQSELRVLFVGSLSVRKGVHYLLQAFDRIVHPNKTLHLVGTESLDYAPVLVPYRNRPDIVFHGHLGQQALNTIMSGSTVLVLPSVEEGLALVQAQAMASGCPVLATNVTGSPDLFTDGVQGFIVPPASSDALAARLQQLADNPSLADSLGIAARARVEQLGGWNEYGDRMFAHYNALLQKNGRA